MKNLGGEVQKSYYSHHPHTLPRCHLWYIPHLERLYFRASEPGAFRWKSICACEWSLAYFQEEVHAHPQSNIFSEIPENVTISSDPWAFLLVFLVYWLQYWKQQHLMFAGLPISTLLPHHWPPNDLWNAYGWLLTIVDKKISLYWSSHLRSLSPEYDVIRPLPQLEK